MDNWPRSRRKHDTVALPENKGTPLENHIMEDFSREHIMVTAHKPNKFEISN